MSFKPEVLVSGKWSRNSLVFATQAEAQQNAHALFMRWFACEDSRAVEVDEPVTHTWIDGELGHIEKVAS